MTWRIQKNGDRVDTKSKTKESLLDGKKGVVEKDLERHVDVELLDGPSAGTPHAVHLFPKSRVALALPANSAESLPQGWLPKR